DPFPEDLVLPGTRGEAPAAAVRRLPGGLEQEQAAVGIGRIDAAAEEIAGDRGVVLLRLVAEKRQAEAALALERTVAGAGVASHAAEEAHQVPLEIDHFELAAVGQRDRRRGRGALEQDQATGKSASGPESTDAASRHGKAPVLVTKPAVGGRFVSIPRPCRTSPLFPQRSARVHYFLCTTAIVCRKVLSLAPTCVGVHGEPSSRVGE